MTGRFFAQRRCAEPVSPAPSATHDLQGASVPHVDCATLRNSLCGTRQSTVVPGSERTLHSYTATPRQSQLNLQDNPISPNNASFSEVTIGAPLAQTLSQMQRGAFQMTPQNFTALAREVGAQQNLNSSELYAAANTLMATIRQRPSEYANPAREALTALLQNNPHLVAEQLVIAAHISTHLDATHVYNQAIRSAATNILSGRTADGGAHLNLSAISTTADFGSAAQALLNAYSGAPQDTQAIIRSTMAQLFESTRITQNNGGWEFRAQCADVIRDPSNSAILSGDSPSAVRLRAALDATIDFSAAGRYQSL